MARVAKFDIGYKNNSDSAVKSFTDQLTKQLSQYSSIGTEKIMEQFLEKVKESMEKYVPEDTQATRNSWFSEVQVEGNQVIGIFGHDKEGELEYIPFIYVGGVAGIKFQKSGAIPYWLETAVQDNINWLESELSKGER